MYAIANFLTGFRAIVVGFLIFVLYRLFEVQALFYRFLPLADEVKTVASILIAIVVVFSLMIFSAHINFFRESNYEDDGAWIKWLMFLFTLFINVFFWKVWDPNITIDNKTIEISPTLVYTFKGIIAFFFGAFDFAYNDLFLKKWNRRNEDLIDQRQLLQTEVSQLEAKQKELQLEVSQSNEELSKLLARLSPDTCPKCLRVFPTFSARNAHMRTCN